MKTVWPDRLVIPTDPPWAAITVTPTPAGAAPTGSRADESRAGYERTKFRHWVDADRDGCHSRAEVLKAEDIEARSWGRAAC
ncbi:hypothetical protein [Streptomyces sp. NPDC050804]|uniref:hypothetical protein n=1 Tax=Streptomyces sp. NPDC050804 TaxID=3154745 RepID=UPI003433B184